MVASRVMVGAIDETELVLRGGYLKSPVVATGLKVVGGKKYIYLTKNNRILNNFLKGKLNSKNPLQALDV